MQTRQREIFTTIHVEGAILPPDLLQRIAAGASDLDGLTPESYHLLEGEKINEAVNRSWSRLLGAWTTFKNHADKLPDKDIGTSVTRERWLLPLFQELGYGRLPTAKTAEIQGKTYPISHTWQNTPIHLVGCRVDLDKRTAGVTGAARSSPHSLLQEFLNRSDDHLWGFVCNGFKFRILRDNVSLTRQAYVEFDLQSMMAGEIYADFVLLWLLCHQSRVEAERPEACWLEKWSRTAQEKGTRALDQLRKGVEHAITALGRGFLLHPDNQLLRQKLQNGELDKQEYYRQLLRLVYRLIFLFVAEDRALLLSSDADLRAQEVYMRYYSTARLRRLAERQRGTRHADLFQGLRLVMQKLGSEQGCPQLGLPALGSYLFSSQAMPDLESNEIANRDLLDAIRPLAFITDGHTRRPVDYKNLGCEELGSVYESLLELHPDVNVDVGTFELKTGGGHERKTTGSYYTPSSLIQVLLDSALDAVLEEAVQKEDPEKAILNLKICDPACGSGHFLIAAAHRLARRLAAVRTGDEESAPDAIRTALRDVIGHCIYGVDMNEMAVELCKVGLWMEALEPGKPLSFLDHRIQCGNSLLGTTPALLAKGIPDAAFKPIEGDDKTVCSEDKKLNKKERETGQRTLFDAEGQPWLRLGNLATAMMNLDDIADDTIAGIQSKQQTYEQLVKSSGYKYNRLLADAWCAAFVWKKTKEFPYPITEEILRRIEHNPHSIPKWLLEEVQRLAEEYRFFHWHLAFPEVFRIPAKGEEPENEQTGWSDGFDVVLGNPPWERIKLQEKEWFANRRPEIANAPNAAQRRKMIANLASEDLALYQAFLEDKRQAEGEGHLVRECGRYPLTGGGDINTYAIFAEHVKNSINPTGRCGIIIPIGIATDYTYKDFFASLIENESLVSFYDFENREGIFIGVHRNYNFALITMTGSNKPVLESEFAFFMTKIEHLKDNQRRFCLSKEDFRLMNPNTHTCPIFNSRKDAELTRNIYKLCPVIIKEQTNENEFGISFIRMFDMTNDSNLFRTAEELESLGFKLNTNSFFNEDKVYLPLYESKMIHQFDHRHGTFKNQTSEEIKQGYCKELSEYDCADPNFTVIPRLWVPEIEVKQRTEKWSNNHKWFIGFRNVTRAVDRRSATFTVLPYCGAGNSVPVIFFELFDLKKVILFLANVNSFPFDYVVRQKIGGINLNFFLVKQLPIISHEKYLPEIQSFITSNVIELTYTTWDLEPFAKDCGYDGPPFRWDEARRFLLRCELDAAYFHLYGIEREDVDYIMETFPIVKRKDEQKYGEYRTKRVILEIYDEMAAAMRTSIRYQTRLDPPPADPRVAHGYVEEEMDTELLRLYTLLLASELAKNPLKVFIVKILYIAEACKFIRQNYPWMLRPFGPYPEGNIFDAQLDGLKSQNLIEQEDEYSQVADQPILITDTGITKLRNLESKFTLREVKQSIEKIMNDFNKYGSKDMELRATLIYLQKNHPSWNYDQLVAGIKEVKGRKFHDNEIENAYIELMEKGYI